MFHENPREAALQALLARGDRRVADFVELAACLGGDWRRALREWDGDAALFTPARRGRSTEILPWDHFDVGVKKAGLVREWERADRAGRGAGMKSGPSERRMPLLQGRDGHARSRPAQGRVVEAGGQDPRALQRGGRLPRHRQHLSRTAAGRLATATSTGRS